MNLLEPMNPASESLHLSKLINGIESLKFYLLTMTRYTLALIVTWLLFIVMYQLVKVDEEPYLPIIRIAIPPVVMETRDIPVFLEELLPELLPPLSPPELPAEQVLIKDQHLSISPPRVLVTASKEELTVRQTRTQSIPIFRVSPIYPAGPLSRGIEGYVDVIFDVNERGSTQNIRIFAADPARVFNRAASKAVSRWKYNPRMEEGKGVLQKDVVTRVRFNIKD